MSPTTLFVLSLLALLSISAPATAKFAYTTLLLDDAFIAGVRVLGLSLANTGTPHDKVLLYSPAISKATIELMEREGWKPKKIDLVWSFHTQRSIHLLGCESPLWLSCPYTGTSRAAEMGLNRSH